MKKIVKESDMNYKLEDLVDIKLFQALQDKLNKIYNFPSAVIDNDGKILVATAWQDICTKFHRQNPLTEEECVKSDKYILNHLDEANPAVSYRCPHGMIDNAIPIIINGKHLANFFTGQFFLEPPNINFFKKQAKKYNFDEKEYLEAVAKVPIWSQEKLDKYLGFIKQFTEMLVDIGYKNLMEIENRKKIIEQKTTIQESEEKLVQAQYLANMGDFTWNIQTDEVSWSDGMHKLLKYDKDDKINYTKVNRDIHHPNDLERVTKWLMDSIASGNKELEQNEYRLVCKNGEIKYVRTNGTIEYKNGKAVQLFGTCIDITESKKAEVDQKTKMKQLQMMNDIMTDRELILNETRKEVNKLLAKLGEDEKYKTI
jgi:PAS domain S-box-containing protein